MWFAIYFTTRNFVWNITFELHNMLCMPFCLSLSLVSSGLSFSLTWWSLWSLASQQEWRVKRHHWERRENDMLNALQSQLLNMLFGFYFSSLFLSFLHSLTYWLSRSHICLVESQTRASKTTIEYEIEIERAEQVEEQEKEVERNARQHAGWHEKVKSEKHNHRKREREK